MKDKIKILLEKNYNITTLKPIVKNILESFDDDQLTHLLISGIKISSDISLQYLPGVGFRCWNENADIIGNLPICNIIEKNLNNELLKS